MHLIEVSNNNKDRSCVMFEKGFEFKITNVTMLHLTMRIEF